MKYVLSSIKYLNNYVIFLLLDFLINRKRNIIHPNTLLLIKLDAIGDYILFRNFIPSLIEGKFRNYKITYCGNSEIKELVLSYDKEFFNDFIWIDRVKFSSSIVYKYKILKDIYSRGFELAINTAYTREILFGDQIIKTCNAKVRIGSIGSQDHRNNTRIFSDRFYTRLIPSSEKNLFEFYRNKEFLEVLTNNKIMSDSPSIAPLSICNDFGLTSYIILFPGSKEKIKRWSPINFAKVGNYILKNFDYNIVIAGSRGDKLNTEGIIHKIGNDKRVIDLTGQTSLSELVKIISGSELLISNDTAAVHISAALNKKFICVANGYQLGRFNPYPSEICNKGYFIYPEEINETDYEILRFDAGLDINKIRPESINALIRNILS